MIREKRSGGELSLAIVAGILANGALLVAGLILLFVGFMSAASGKTGTTATQFLSEFWPLFGAVGLGVIADVLIARRKAALALLAGVGGGAMLAVFFRALPV